MLDTGLRLEVINLQAENVDLDNRFLLVMGKGRKERSVPFGFTTEYAERMDRPMLSPNKLCTQCGWNMISSVRDPCWNCLRCPNRELKKVFRPEPPLTRGAADRGPLLLQRRDGRR